MSDQTIMQYVSELWVQVTPDQYSQAFTSKPVLARET